SLLCSNRKNTRNNPILQEYVLPDFSRNKKGYIRVFFFDFMVFFFQYSKFLHLEIFQKSKENVPAYLEMNYHDDEQVLYINNERFSVPEILFHPSDIGAMNMHMFP